MSDQDSKVDELVGGLRALADFVEANAAYGPKIAAHLAGKPIEFMAGAWGEEAEQLAEFARRGLAAGAKVAKGVEHDGNYFHVAVTFGGSVVVRSWAARERVCVRVVTGSREVTRRVKDPAALAAVPEVTVTEEGIDSDRG